MPNKPNLNSTMATNSLDSSKFHNCVDTNCDGANFNGINFTCALCSQHMFIQCLTDNPEMVCILDLISPNWKQKKVPSTNLNVLNVAISSLFSQSSLFNFVCIECKSLGSLKDIEQQHENKLIDERKKVQQLSAKIESIQCDNSKSIETLTHQLEQANEQLKQFKLNAANNSTTSDLCITIASLESLVTDMSNANKAQAIQCDQLSTALHEIQSKLKSTNIPVIDINDSSLSFGNKSYQHGSMLEPSHERVVKTPLDANGINSQNGTKLQPPSQKLKPADLVTESVNVFTIYVSKFHPSNTCEDISQHINMCSKNKELH